MKHLIKKIFKMLGAGLVSKKKLAQLIDIESDSNDLLDLILKKSDLNCSSKAQLKQDIIVLLSTNFKKNGFFVEFGATNGVSLSNTYILEKSYDWKGILAEPAKVWHKDLVKNRSAEIDFSCVWSKSNEILSFNMVDEAELSTITKYNGKDNHSKDRNKGITYDVKTISLNDLLEKHNAPRNIDYLSIDTEGSELEILQNFDFKKYEISIISCEHNYTEDRLKIYKLLTNNGYTRKFKGLSKWDDWYFKTD